MSSELASDQIKADDGAFRVHVVSTLQREFEAWRDAIDANVEVDPTDKYGAGSRCNARMWAIVELAKELGIELNT